MSSHGPGVVFPSAHSRPVGGHLKQFAPEWRRLLKLSPWHLTALEGMPLEWDSIPSHNLPFDSAARYRPDSKERQACSKTLAHYLEIGSVMPLPVNTTDGLWSTFFPVPKKGTDKMRGCLDLRGLNDHLTYHHFKMEGLHTVA